MNLKNIISLFFILILCFSSCKNQEFSSRDQLYNYISKEDNGYLVVKQLGEVNVELMCKPTDLVVWENLPENFTKGMVENYRTQFEDNLYFLLRISVNNNDLLKQLPRDNNDFANWTNKLTFGMGQEVSLQNEKGEEFALKDYVYPRMYGSSRANTMMFIFSKTSDFTDDMIFTLNEFGLGTGELNFRISSDKIINQPKLEFNYEKN